MKKLTSFLLVTAILGFVFALYQVDWNLVHLFGNKPVHTKRDEYREGNPPTIRELTMPPSCEPPIILNKKPADRAKKGSPPLQPMIKGTWI